MKDRIFPIPYGVSNNLIQEGKTRGNKKMECYGKDMLASTLIERGFPEDLQTAIYLFEEVKIIDPRFISQEYYQKALVKLGGS